jgi:hypothetical protein
MGLDPLVRFVSSCPHARNSVTFPGSGVTASIEAYNNGDLVPPSPKPASTSAIGVSV